ncbi:MAG: hypothetical protein UW78_C0024G0002 [Candidatus Azambacteria bacterium GW2011_GWA1_44_9]|uniref:Uncharacterized protein n=1 Tax=Candidatus Azambacteria bacterium GW2011_GWA1_44_9 TaxID=1618610 RepID=A0A0G1MJ11_9BACT|nr:MAG: hypothetical protein UW78_C0024G0002 [Candidatus Azambacteria bacterium GW2011_GWA1_44_9]
MAVLEGTKRRVYLVQVNHQFGRNVFVPYSVGSLVAYVQTIPDIKDNFQFMPFAFLREDPNHVVAKMCDPSIVGFSCYLWNWEYNLKLAQLVRLAYPKTTIIFGGNHAPDASEGFFLKHPYVDIVVHGEGEFTFAEFLLESLNSAPDYSKISGLSFPLPDGTTHKTAERKRANDLSVLPSPYLTGVFDFMLTGNDFLFNASQETNRGCPYTCKFCDWGKGEAKLFQMEETRILAEYEWFGQHQVEYLLCCDSNYGIFPRDFHLTEKMIEIRAKYAGFPRAFRACTAKNSDDRVFAITQILNEAGMSKGTALSFQSMNDETLRLVSRRNIKIEKFSDLMDRYRQAGIATYTELIIGMPGETYESSKKGVDQLMDGQDDSIRLIVYPCTMLPNSGVSEPDYIKLHGIQSVRHPILLAHSTPALDPAPEFQQIIVGTELMPPAEWRRTHLFYWAVQCFHCLGLLQSLAILFHKQLGMKYSDFYEKLLEYFASNDQTVVGREITLVSGVVDKMMKGGSLDLVIPQFGAICWPLEEASFLNLVVQKDQLYREIKIFTEALLQVEALDLPAGLLSDLIRYQSAVVVDPFSLEPAIELEYDWPRYFAQQGQEQISSCFGPICLTIKASEGFAGDLKKYAQEVVWYGRKENRTLFPLSAMETK